MSVKIKPPGRKRRLPPAVPTEPVYRLSVAQYHQMIDAGILTENDPVELLEGWLVPKMPKKRRHSVATRRIRKFLEQILPAGWLVESQEPVTTDTSEPEPDVMVARAETEDDLENQPGPKSVALIVEVSDTTLRHDRGFKKRVYARARVPVYWIINLVQNRVEVYTDPTGPAKEPDYRIRQEYKPGDDVPVVIAGRKVGKVPVKDLLP
jgi:Uma2 family endonuclease